MAATSAVQSVVRGCRRSKDSTTSNGTIIRMGALKSWMSSRADSNSVAVSMPSTNTSSKTAVTTQYRSPSSRPWVSAALTTCRLRVQYRMPKNSSATREPRVHPCMDSQPSTCRTTASMASMAKKKNSIIRRVPLRRCTSR
jgi:hypothetical protein